MKRFCTGIHHRISYKGGRECGQMHEEEWGEDGRMDGRKRGGGETAFNPHSTIEIRSGRHAGTVAVG